MKPYHRAIQRFEPCPVCGRKIRLTRHGIFRRHVYKSVVCSGSWNGVVEKQEQARLTQEQRTALEAK